MKMSLASSTSAHASAKDKKIVFLAGTYVIGFHAPSLLWPTLGDRNLTSKRRTTKQPQININYDMLSDSNFLGDLLRFLDFKLMTLAVTKRDC
jgi:hypothetical protein